MIDLLFEGGILFMSILTIVLAASCGLFVFYLIKKTKDESQTSLIKSVGLFALVFGLLGQFIGLYSALQHISQVESVSSAMLAGGIRVSSITSIYGMLIFILSYLMWFVLKSIRSVD
ncbi:MotA/TolQ/ExbB proton channel family protein [Reichenbachiella faecimaris]|uniref:MotA/TolQ/ExbB proton channel family protein n=1 Tax=Reichenbachiella faecimaris TaxID=692418 RepID=A0A1W2GIF4_REIFA|nr:MotA/TolQ/ExbB proton channel family protein [Reichenbachiella faecimaris]SMD36138.1 MotA/TolQ/ExbB proton channel family protein [Reichenbachiella faecimaris]